MKKTFILIFIATALLLFIFLIKSEIFKIKSKTEITDKQKIELYDLALQAKENGDLPISALLLNSNEVIGKGFNTVVRDSDITGHAEINALRDAINKIGLDKFIKIDKSEMIIISTLEPCEMCKGVILHYKIKNIQFIKDKSLFSGLYGNYNEFRYQLNKQQISSPMLLDSLSKLHPDY